MKIFCLTSFALSLVFGFHSDIAGAGSIRPNLKVASAAPTFRCLNRVQCSSTLTLQGVEVKSSAFQTQVKIATHKTRFSPPQYILTMDFPYTASFEIVQSKLRRTLIEPIENRAVIVDELISAGSGYSYMLAFAAKDPSYVETVEALVAKYQGETFFDVKLAIKPLQLISVERSHEFYDVEKLTFVRDSIIGNSYSTLNEWYDERTRDFDALTNGNVFDYIALVFEQWLKPLHILSVPDRNELLRYSDQLVMLQKSFLLSFGHHETYHFGWDFGVGRSCKDMQYGNCAGEPRERR